MSSPGEMNPESDEFQQHASRPSFVIGQHDSSRWEVLSEKQHSHIVSCGVSLLRLRGKGKPRVGACADRLTPFSSTSPRRPSPTATSTAVSWICTTPT